MPPETEQDMLARLGSGRRPRSQQESAPSILRRTGDFMSDVVGVAGAINVA